MPAAASTIVVVPAAFADLLTALAGARRVGAGLTWETQSAFWAAWPVTVPVSDWAAATRLARRLLHASLTYCPQTRRVHLRPL